MTSLMSEPGSDGRFGDFGGRFVPESLMPACLDLEQAFKEAWADPAFHRELDDLLAHYGGRPTPVTAMPAALREAGRAGAAQARGPGAHRLAQDEQRRRAGAAHPAHGQDAHHRRDRGRAARGGVGHGGGAVRPRVHRVHGGGGHQAPGAERLPDGAAGRRGAPGDLGQPHLEGCGERGHARVGGHGRAHPLLPGLGHGPAPVPLHGARVAAGGGRRGARPEPDDPRRRRPRRGGGVRRRGLERRRDVRRLRRYARRGWSVSRRPAAPRSPTGSPACCTACTRSCCRTRPVRSWRRSRSRPGSTTPDSGPSTPTWPPSAGPSTPRPTTPRCSRRSGCCRHTEGIIPALESAHAVAWVARAAGTAALPAGSTVLITLSGRGDKDVAQVREIFGTRPCMSSKRRYGRSGGAAASS